MKNKWPVKRVDEANFALGTTDSNNLLDYIEIIPVLETDLNKGMQLGNDIETAFAEYTNRATTVENIYLKAGAKVSLKDSTTYSMGIGYQTGETLETKPTASWLSTWTTSTITIPTSGWYAFTVKRNDEVDIDIGGTDPELITGYLNFEY